MYRGGRIYSKKVVIDNIKFDSEMESLYYLELKERLAKGEISDLEIHKGYILLEEFTNANGKVHKAITYEPDFIFYDKVEKRTRYIDIKGMLTDDFKLKWKMFDFYYLKHPFQGYLEVLKYSKTTGFVPIEQYKAIMKSKRQQLVAEKNALKGELATIKKAQQKDERLKTRLLELRELAKTTKLSSAQRKRLDELELYFKDKILVV